MSATKIEGSCLCGGIRYEASGPLTAVGRCHCRECRKASGAEFATNATVAPGSLRFVEGEALLGTFESSPGQERCFCTRCGSPILKRYADDPDRVRIRLGCVDTPIEERPVVRVFVSEKLDLTEIDDDLPRFDTIPGA
jgi:hypothetical protein